jgi:hypothetical protein
MNMPDATFDYIMTMARRPGWLGHAWERAKECGKHERLYGWGWYAGVQERVQAAIVAEGLNPKSKTNEETNESLNPPEDGHRAEPAGALAGARSPSEERAMGDAHRSRRAAEARAAVHGAAAARGAEQRAGPARQPAGQRQGRG